MRRPVGRPSKDGAQCLEVDVTNCEVGAAEWIHMAHNWEEWQGLTKAVMGLDGLTTSRLIL